MAGLKDGRNMLKTSTDIITKSFAGILKGISVAIFRKRARTTTVNCELGNLISGSVNSAEDKAIASVIELAI